MTYKSEECVLRNLFYGRLLTTMRLGPPYRRSKRSWIQYYCRHHSTVIRFVLVSLTSSIICPARCLRLRSFSAFGIGESRSQGGDITTRRAANCPHQAGESEGGCSDRCRKPRSFTKTLKPPTKFSWQTTLAKAEARLVELQAQPTARPDLSLFLTKALDSAKPDYTGLASLLIAARPAARLFVPGLRQRNQHIQFHNWWRW